LARGRESDLNSVPPLIVTSKWGHRRALVREKNHSSEVRRTIGIETFLERMVKANQLAGHNEWRQA